MGVARNATIRIGKVPVMYVPWFMFPIDERRRTGLLYPQLSLSGRNGFDWKQPIYLNLAPNYDATLYPRYMSDRGSLLGAEFRWLYPNGRGEVYGNWMPQRRPAGRRARPLPQRPQRQSRSRARPCRKTIAASSRLTASHNLNSAWYANTNLGWVSDTHYFEDFSSSLYGISNYSIRSDAGLYGRGRYWEASLMADHYQLADYTLTDASLAFDRLPRAYASLGAAVFGHWLQAGVDTEAVRFQHTEFLGGSRLDLKPFIVDAAGRRELVHPAQAGLALHDLPVGRQRDRARQRVRPSLRRHRHSGADRTVQRRHADSQPADHLGRCRPVLRPQHADPWRQLPAYAGTADLLPERAPYRDQDGLPIFDTGPTTFSWGQLFRDNRYTGADRQTDANQLTAALTTRLISEDSRPGAPGGQHRPDLLLRRQPGHPAQRDPDRAGQVGLDRRRQRLAQRPLDASAPPTCGTRSTAPRT